MESSLSDDEIITLAHRMGSTIMAYAFDLEKVADEVSVGEDEGFVSGDEDMVMPKGMVPLADMLNADADKNNVTITTCWPHKQSLTSMSRPNFSKRNQDWR
jgi:SET domain-containing protein 6